MSNDEADLTRVSLLERLRNSQCGDDFEQAWKTFNQRYTPKMLYWISSYGVSQIDAEEICQELMVCLLRRMKTYRYDGRSFRGYLKTVAKHAVFDFLEKRKRYKPVSGEALACLIDRKPIEDELDRYFDLEILEQAKEMLRSELESSEVGRRNWSIFIELESGATTPEALAMKYAIRVPLVYVARNRIINHLREKVRLLEK